MKNKFIEWITTLIVDKIQLPPKVVAIIAAILAAMIYGLKYFETLIGFEMPNLDGFEGVAAFILGVLLQWYPKKNVAQGIPNSSPKKLN